MHNVKFFDYFGALTDEYEAYSPEALARDGAEILRKGGAVHFTTRLGKNYMFRGHFPETRAEVIRNFEWACNNCN